MSENTHALTAADFADILTTTLAMASEAGLSIGVQNRPATETRPAGLLLFVSGLAVDAQGHIAAAEFAVAAPEEPTS